MKIRLYAFGEKLVGRELIDVPENTTTTFDMVLTQPMTKMWGQLGDKIEVRCKFEWNGKIEMESGARVYQLVDIVKIEP